MKRRANPEKKSGQSPYQKYGKAPLRYSDLYHQWRDALLKGRTAEARRLGEQHTTRWLGDFIRHRDAA